MVVNFLRMTCSLTAVFLFVASAQGATLYVDADAPGPADGMSWSTAFTNPQYALAIAVAGDDIYVAQGTYMPNGARVGDDGYVAGELEAVPFQLIDCVRIMGGYAGFGEADPDDRNVTVYETIFSGDLTNNDVPVICTSRAHCSSYGYRCTNGFCILKDQILPFVENIVTGHGTDVTAVLDGVTVSDGFSSSGSGMRNNSGSPTVSNCTFTGNNASGAGAGMYNIESSPTVTYCKFIGNFAFGAGAGISNVNSSAATTLITDCIFSDNVSFSGAGIRNIGPRDIESTSTLRITNCIFNQNDVTPLGSGHGGGMHNSGYAVAIVSNCLFIGNTAHSGGGLANSGTVNRTNGSVTLTNCAFMGNHASSEGGGIYNFTSETTTLINCVFSGNTASRGGGLFEDGRLFPATSVTNCTFSGNTSINPTTSWGGGIVNRTTSLKLNNCILFGNSPIEFTAWNSNPEFSYCNIAGSGGSAAWDSSLGVDRGGNIDVNPLFVDADRTDDTVGTVDDNLRLLLGSPSIDAANYDNYDSVGGGPLDLDLTARTIDIIDTVDTGFGVLTYLDMGAYEAGECTDGGTQNNCDVDCAGVLGGLALVDDCGVCAGGNTGRSPNADKDCNGDCFGSASLDACDICAGGNTGLEHDADRDCAGVCFGDATTDDCGVCAGGSTGQSPNADQDCNGVCFGSALLDDCGVCSGGDTGHDPNSDTDCNDDCFGDALVDDCGACAGGGTGLESNADKDCNGDCFGSAFIDDCDICAGGNTGIEPRNLKECTEDCAGVLGGLALVDECGVCAGGSTGLESNADKDCNGDCFGSAFIDDCDTCAGGSTGQSPNADQDCNGECFGSAILDDCSVCSGGNTGRDPNSDKDCNGDCFGTAMVDICGICAGGNTDVEPSSPGDCGGEVLMDIKPGSCPNAFNRGSRGVLPLAILSTASFDATSIDLDSLTLSRTDGRGVPLMLESGRGMINMVFKDVATPFVGNTCECHTGERDGLPDLRIHVSSSALSEALALNLLDVGARVELRVQGLLMDGSAFEAVDCIWLTNGRNHRRRRGN